MTGNCYNPADIAISAKIPLELSRLFGVSHSTSCPWSSTMILSYCITVLSLWAMVRTVQEEKEVWIVLWMRWSVLRSRLAVASSSRRMLFLLTRARARHINCFSPTEKLSPSASTTRSSPLVSALTFSSRLLSFTTRQSSSSLDWPKGSMFCLRLVWKRTGSWGMTARRDLRSVRPSLL